MSASFHKKYQPPVTTFYKMFTNDICIGFGEGSIPPEDSDTNQGWFEEDLTEGYNIPIHHIKLWDE